MGRLRWPSREVEALQPATRWPGLMHYSGRPGAGNRIGADTDPADKCTTFPAGQSGWDRDRRHSDHTVRGRATLNTRQIRLTRPVVTWASDPIGVLHLGSADHHGGTGAGALTLGTGGAVSTGAGPWSFTAGSPPGSPNGMRVRRHDPGPRDPRPRCASAWTSSATTSRPTSARSSGGERSSSRPTWRPACWPGGAAGITIATTGSSATPAARAASGLIRGYGVSPVRPSRDDPMPQTLARRAPLHRQRGGPRRRDRHVRRPDRAVRPGGRAVGRRGDHARSSSPPAWPRSPPARSPWAWAAISPPAATPSTTPARSCARSARSRTCPTSRTDEVAEVFRTYGLTDAEIAPILRAFRKQPPGLGRFHDAVRAGPGGARPQARRCTSALTIAGSYIVGGLIPLSPYMRDQLTPTTRADRLGRGDAAGAAGVRLRQGPVHRHPALAQCRCRRC